MLVTQEAGYQYNECEPTASVVSPEEKGIIALAAIKTRQQQA